MKEAIIAMIIMTMVFVCMGALCWLIYRKTLHLDSSNKRNISHEQERNDNPRNR